MLLGLARDPPQDEVDRGNQLDFQGIRVQRVFAGRQRALPDATLPRFDLLAVPEAGAGQVGAEAAVVRDDHSDVADRDERLRAGLDRGEPPVEKEGAVGQDLELLAAVAAEREERLGVLEVVVVPALRVRHRLGRDDLARLDGRAVLNRDDADRVGGFERDVGTAHDDLRLLGGRLLGPVADQDRLEALDGGELRLPGCKLPAVLVADRA